MTVKIGINGFGRIGRCVLRAFMQSNRSDVEVVALNYRKNTEEKRHLFKYDSTHGAYPGTVEGNKDKEFIIDGKPLHIFHEDAPENINWAEAGVDVVLECTGVFKKHADASKHLGETVKKVLISAPSPDPDATIVYGVNNQVLTGDEKIISIGSCTTNCLAPVAKILNDEFCIENGFMTTVHAYTGDQNLLDNGHRDLRRARAAALSMIPTSTGAAKALGLVLPELNGKLDGVALRVPTSNVSFVDLTFNSAKNTNADEINAALKKASEGAMKGVLAYNEEPLVSIDFNGNPNSSIFDATQTKVTGDKLVRVASWYDNEWGFSERMLDVAALIA